MLRRHAPSVGTPATSTPLPVLGWVARYNNDAVRTCSGQHSVIRVFSVYVLKLGAAKGALSKQLPRTKTELLLKLASSNHTHTERSQNSRPRLAPLAILSSMVGGGRRSVKTLPRLVQSERRSGSAAAWREPKHLQTPRCLSLRSSRALCAASVAGRVTRASSPPPCCSPLTPRPGGDSRPFVPCSLRRWLQSKPVTHCVPRRQLVPRNQAPRLQLLLRGEGSRKKKSDRACGKPASQTRRRVRMRLQDGTGLLQC